MFKRVTNVRMHGSNKQVMLLNLSYVVIDFFYEAGCSNAMQRLLCHSLVHSKKSDKAMRQ